MIRFGILTISDRSSSNTRPDTSGPALVAKINAVPYDVTHTDLISDDLEKIQEILLAWCDSGDVDVILTTGGTGFSQRDNTPEATRAVIQKSTPGISEAIRSQGLLKTPHAMLSRGVAGIRAQTLIVNLPGSPKAALESLEAILPVLPHAVALINSEPDAEDGHTPGPSRNIN